MSTINLFSICYYLQGSIVYSLVPRHFWRLCYVRRKSSSTMWSWFIESWTALFGKWKALPALSCALSNSSRYNINEYISPLKIMFTLKHFNLYSIKFVVMLGSPQYKHKGKWKTPFKVIVKMQFLKHFVWKLSCFVYGGKITWGWLIISIKTLTSPDELFNFHTCHSQKGEKFIFSFE